MNNTIVFASRWEIYTVNKIIFWVRKREERGFAKREVAVVEGYYSRGSHLAGASCRTVVASYRGNARVEKPRASTVFVSYLGWFWTQMCWSLVAFWFIFFLVIGWQGWRQEAVGNRLPTSPRRESPLVHQIGWRKQLLWRLRLHPFQLKVEDHIRLVGWVIECGLWTTGHLKAQKEI